MDRILLRVDEAAEALSMGRTRMYSLIVAGELPVVRIGKSIRVPAQALMEWAEARTVGPAERGR